MRVQFSFIYAKIQATERQESLFYGRAGGEQAFVKTVQLRFNKQRPVSDTLRAAGVQPSPARARAEPSTAGWPTAALGSRAA